MPFINEKPSRIIIFIIIIIINIMPSTGFGGFGNYGSDSSKTPNSEIKKEVEDEYLNFLSKLSTEKYKADQLESMDHDIHDLIKKKNETIERIEIETKYMAYLKVKIDEATKLKNENDVLMNELKKLNSDNVILEGEYKKILPEGYKFEKNQPIS